MGNANTQNNSNYGVMAFGLYHYPTQTTLLLVSHIKGLLQTLLVDQRATETFGPIGLGWGVDVKDQGFQNLMK